MDSSGIPAVSVYTCFLTGAWNLVSAAYITRVLIFILSKGRDYLDVYRERLKLG